MSYLTDNEAERLLDEARQACVHTYSPYSAFVTGAVVLAADGQVYKGTNVENASYGLTICAERIALGNAITAGVKKIAAIAVYANVDSISPCGACRQFIIEFGGDIIIVFRQNGNTIQKKADELLPYQFLLPA